jgi:hypothetical protein
MDGDKVYTQEQVDAIVKEAVAKSIAEALANVSHTEFISKEKSVEVLGKEYAPDTILKLAKEGFAYREELIQEAIEWGVRAQGNDFPVDAWKQLLSESGRTIEAIKDFREQFKKQADAAIPVGRMSIPSEGNKLEKKSVPDEAYKI